MGGACCIHGRGSICAQDFVCKQREKKIKAKLKITLKYEGRLWYVFFEIRTGTNSRII
jgi:hypothetical protein